MKDFYFLMMFSLFTILGFKGSWQKSVLVRRYIHSQYIVPSQLNLCILMIKIGNNCWVFNLVGLSYVKFFLKRSMEWMHQMFLVSILSIRWKFCEILVSYSLEIFDPVLLKKVKLNNDVFFRQINLYILQFLMCISYGLGCYRHHQKWTTSELFYTSK